ncbi:MAG: hypothetical protein WBR33_00175 [Pseudonocardiaceae bacterium]
MRDGRCPAARAGVLTVFDENEQHGGTEEAHGVDQDGDRRGEQLDEHAAEPRAPQPHEVVVLPQTGPPGH